MNVDNCNNTQRHGLVQKWLATLCTVYCCKTSKFTTRRDMGKGYDAIE